MNKIMNNQKYIEVYQHPKTGTCIIRGMNSIGKNALTYFVYDGDIRIPCGTIEEQGIVKCVYTSPKYLLRICMRLVIKMMKIYIFPKRYVKFILEYLH